VRFAAGGLVNEKTLDFEQTLVELLGLIGQPVTVFLGTHSMPPLTMAVIEGVLERGGESPGMRAAHASRGAALGEHVMFKVGVSSYFPVVRSEFSKTAVPEPGVLLLQFHDYELAVLTDLRSDRTRAERSMS
jgi:hypothetical protein